MLLSICSYTDYEDRNNNRILRVGRFSCRAGPISLGFRVVGIDCDVRSTLFPDVSKLSYDDIDTLNNQSLIDKHYSIEIRDFDLLSNVIESEITTHNVEVIVHCAAQPSHDWACSAPLIDLNINLLGTVNLLENLRLRDYQGLFIFLSTNKVYGDLPNYLPLVESTYRYDLAPIIFFMIALIHQCQLIILFIHCLVVPRRTLISMFKNTLVILE